MNNGQGDERWETNEGEQLASHLSSPLAVRIWPTYITASTEQFELPLAP